MRSREKAQRILRKAVGRVIEYAKVSKAEFIGETQIQDAILFHLSAAAYASRLDAGALSGVHPRVDLLRLRRLEDPLALLHGETSLDEIWEIVSSEIPRIASALDVPKVPNAN